MNKGFIKLIWLADLSRRDAKGNVKKVFHSRESVCVCAIGPDILLFYEHTEQEQKNVSVIGVLSKC